MLFLDLVIFALLVMLAAFFITQVIVPIKNGTPLFPILLPQHRKLESQLAQAKDEVEVSMKAQEVRETRKQARKSGF